MPGWTSSSSTVRPYGVPIGLRIFGLHQRLPLSTHRLMVLILTFIAYTCYHMSRRPISVVKNVLSRNCSQVIVPSDVIVTNTTENNWCDWQPFNGEDANTLLGLLDSSFLFSYAICMFFSGFIAERCHLRYFLSLGMLLSGLLTYAFGIAFYYQIHSIYYFIFIQIICGALQTSGWPAVVSSVGNWFGKSSRGLIFGIWNSHTNVGNILGALIAGYYVEYNWGLSFIVPAIIIAIAGFIMFLFFTPYPEEVGISSVDIQCNNRIIRVSMNNTTENTGYGDNNESVSSTCSSTSQLETLSTQQQHQQQQQQHRRKLRPIGGMTAVDDNNTDTIVLDEEHPLLTNETPMESTDKKAVSFMTALKIPGVIEFSLCLFFAKLVSYTFLYWLPKYIGSSTDSSSSDSAYLSTPFDLGGIIGAIVAGVLVDVTGASALICVVMLIWAIPLLFLYQLYGSVSYWHNIILQFITGTFVNGPYALITTAVSAELGTKLANSHSLATVTAIIDGTGSIGAAIGPLFAGWVSQTGWNNVFYMVMMADLLALISLARIAVQECKRIARNRHRFNF
ncbi:glucose-6-phosphate exchanger SLC37A2-like [Oppia nitens]|uniref:glucose-6-phosphate exchanger SLC37A2-like n=1 Tax=Oppia nitens TaxID=1686743 RepID=UPI0023DB386B|nr:glucose-6-phosphate exchanger SLC37A2-like [Oppia nitens]XP_054154975.1 glucose-6-phosphate exchanger SLC37A2-like [Oppia nitens]